MQSLFFRNLFVNDLKAVTEVLDLPIALRELPSGLPTIEADQRVMDKARETQDGHMNVEFESSAALGVLREKLALWGLTLAVCISVIETVKIPCRKF